ncbi:hypothetical protein M758_3G058500 [Ceratodon purpureus]|uniref:Uncharacterized protein n=1 Tax=Ceratodon purpureus TaxID=3225 RepID=A0A8T0IHP0_CERPU|nr:hypothetical protein KC19_3G059200 [Ceratodon purpureus]KAG0621919.1 hypothetical protein M758_3G058500 [Ceratodon purpureus]
MCLVTNLFLWLWNIIIQTATIISIECLDHSRSNPANIISNLSAETFRSSTDLHTQMLCSLVLLIYC